MHTPNLDKKRQQLDVLIENKVTFSADSSELSIYDTYESAQKVALHSNELLFCAMLTGKKIMHVESSQYHKAFLPHESFVVAPQNKVLIDFPQASLNRPTTCLAIEISRDKINDVSKALNMKQRIAHDALFEYVMSENDAGKATGWSAWYENGKWQEQAPKKTAAKKPAAKSKAKKK